MQENYSYYVVFSKEICIEKHSSVSIATRKHPGIQNYGLQISPSALKP